jgi:hypothetical protein
VGTAPFVVDRLDVYLGDLQLGGFRLYWTTGKTLRWILWGLLYFGRRDLGISPSPSWADARAVAAL